MHDRLLEVVQV